MMWRLPTVSRPGTTALCGRSNTISLARAAGAKSSLPWLSRATSRSFQLTPSHSPLEPMPLRARVRAAALSCTSAAVVAGVSVAGVAVWRERKQNKKKRLFQGLFKQQQQQQQQAGGWWRQAAQTIGINPRTVQGLVDGAIGPIILANLVIFLAWRVAPARVMRRHFTNSVPSLLLPTSCHLPNRAATNTQSFVLNCSIYIYTIYSCCCISTSLTPAQPCAY